MAHVLSAMLHNASILLHKYTRM